MRRLAAALAVLAAAGLILLLLSGRGPAGPVASARASAGGGGEPTAGDSFEPVLGMQAAGVTVLGAAPAQGQTWAYGTLGAAPVEADGHAYADQLVLLHTEGGEHPSGSGWQVLPLPAGAEGKPLGAAGAGGGGGGLPYALDSLGGRVTAAGGVVLLTEGGILAREPGGQMRVLPAPGASKHPGEASAEELLGSGETLPPASAPGGAGTAYAAIEEGGGRTGLLIAPYGDGAGAAAGNGKGAPAGPGVLRFDGESWTREPLTWHASEGEHLTPQALACGPSAGSGSGGASSGENCWLLASYTAPGGGGGGSSGETGRLALFRRVPAAGETGAYEWERVHVNDWLLGETPLPAGVAARPGVSALGATAQSLTVTAQGAWVDFQARAGASGASTDFSELVGVPAAGASGSAGAGAQAGVAGRWCFGQAAAGCEHTVESPLPAAYRSFAQPGAGALGGAADTGATGGDPGARVVTGLPGGTLLELDGAGPFALLPSLGGEGGGRYGAAVALGGAGGFEEGWLGEGTSQTGTYDHQGSSPLVHLTAHPSGDRLQSQPVPFRHPLLAVTQAPGATPGSPEAPLIAVGEDGEIGRYTPGEGWSSEALYNSSGEAVTATLRGVAWPEPNRAYAVGDDGAMWVWSSETGLWETDPAAPYNFDANLTAIAFDPSEPQLGFAVGKQGAILRYGKSWEAISQQSVKREAARIGGELGVQESQLNFTAIAFAGEEAIASYRYVGSGPGPSEGEVEAGGLLVYGEAPACTSEDEQLEAALHTPIPAEERSCWHAEPSARALLAGLAPKATVLSKVAGLPGGGAVAAGPGLVIERDGPPGASGGAGEWRFAPQPLPEAQNVSALAAYREGGAGPVRAIVSIDLDNYLNPNHTNLSAAAGNPYSCDVPPPSGPGQPPPHLCPDPLPATGYVLRQTASGWEDMEHMTYEETGGGEPQDEPARPDPALALLVEPGGGAGVAVGGQTGDLDGSDKPEPALETAAAMRFGAGASSAAGGDSPAPVPLGEGRAVFLAGGEAACEHACGGYVNEGIAPDVLLGHALATAAQVAAGAPGQLRGFLYTGDRLRSRVASLDGETAKEELAAYAGLLAGTNGTPPVYTTASPQDLASGAAGIAPFAQALAPFLPGANVAADGAAYYAFTSTGATGGPVRAIVLDYSREALGSGQEAWLAQELRAAKSGSACGGAPCPAIVMGNAALGFTLPDKSGNDPEPVQAHDASAVVAILCAGGASAYVFDYPGVNVHATTPCPGRAEPLPEYGTGTLGYSSPPSAYQTDSLGSGAMLMLEVETSARNAATNVAPVSARGVPNIAQLALQANGGTLLRRSHVALFEGLARLPLGGHAVAVPGSGAVDVIGPVAYEPIPFDCQGANCGEEVPLEYTFSSSNPEVGGFVEHDPASANPREVLLGANGKPVPDSHSGLFCAYNQGTTTVTVTTGGLSYSMPITVQGGSVEYPCGTVPLKNPPPLPAAASSAFAIPTLPAASPAAPAAAPQPLTILPPPPPAHPAAKPRPHHPLPVYPFLPAAAGLTLLRPLIVPPPLSPVQPTPPSGTSSVQVYQNAVAPEREREEEAAIDIVHNMAAYTRDPGNPLTPYIPAAVLLLAVTGAGLYDVRVRRGLKLARSGSSSERRAR